MRGLVISVPMEISGSRICISGADLDPQELRSNLLFWDKLEFPDNNLLHIGHSADAEYLMEAGVLQRTIALFQRTTDVAQMMRDCHIGTYRRLEAREPGQWSLAIGKNSISFPNEEIEEGRGALVRLYNAIPVPDKDAPLADILEFKEKRNSELHALRQYMEAAYQRVVNAGDGALAWQSEIEALQSSIDDHIRASREAPFNFRLANISANLNPIAVGTGIVAAHTLNLPLISGAITGLVSGISVNISGALKKKAVSSTPFKYVTSYHQALF